MVEILPIQSEIKKLEPLRNQALKQREEFASGIRAGNKSRELQVQFRKFDNRFRDFDNRIKILKRSRSLKDFGQQFSQVQESKRLRETRAIDIRDFKLRAKRGEGTLIRGSFGEIKGFRPKQIKREIRKKIPTKKINQFKFVPSTFKIPQVKKTPFLTKKLGTLKKLGKELFGIEGKEINKEQQSLNKEIEKFNEKFKDKKLPQEEFNKAKRLSILLAIKQKNLNKRSKELEESITTKAKTSFFGPERIKFKQTEKDKKKLSENIKKLEKELSEKKLNPLTRKIKQNTLEEAKLQLETGTARLIAGDVPIIPVGVAGAISKVAKIKFVGKQITKGNKIITNVAFIQNGKRVGLAKGITFQKGNKGFSVVAGKSGIKGVQFPNGKTTIKRVQSFVAKELGQVKTSKFVLNRNINLLKNKRTIGKINVIKKNLDGLSQIGIGKIASVKGNKFVRTSIKAPSGKLFKVPVKNINRDSFVSISAIFTKGQLSKIVGKTITLKGQKARFIGIIKGETGTRGLSSLSSTTRTQYTQALNKVIGATSAALSKTAKVKGLTGGLKLATAATIASSKPITLLKAKTTPQILLKRSVNLKQAQKVRQKINTQLKLKQREIQKIRSVLRLKTATKTQQKVKQTLRQQLKQSTKQVTRLKQAQKQIQQSRLSKIGKTIIISKVPATLRPFLFPKIKRKIKKRKAKRISKKKGYNVLARPLKKKRINKRPKLIKVNKVPLRKSKAKDLRNYIVDTSLSRTGKIKKSGKRARPPRIKVPLGYAKRTSKKFRTFRIVKGKRIPMKNVVIERRKNLLDTIQERKRITLRRRISQLKKKPIRQIAIASNRKIKSIKFVRKATPQQLRNLAKGRRKLASIRAKERRQILIKSKKRKIRPKRRR